MWPAKIARQQVGNRIQGISLVVRGIIQRYCKGRSGERRSGILKDSYFLSAVRKRGDILLSIVIEIPHHDRIGGSIDGIEQGRRKVSAPVSIRHGYLRSPIKKGDVQVPVLIEVPNRDVTGAGATGESHRSRKSAGSAVHLN